MSRTGSISRLEETAYHEAGHAVLAWLAGSPFERVSIIPEEDSAGHIINPWWKLAEPPNEFVNLTCPTCGAYVTPLVAQCFRDDELRDEGDVALHAAQVLYAGGEAVKLRRGVRQRSVGCGSDDAQIADVIASAWPDYDDATHRALCRYLRLSARAELRREWVEVSALAAALLERRTLTGDEARAVLSAVPREGLSEHTVAEPAT
jgi:hypothetical protein